MVCTIAQLHNCTIAHYTLYIAHCTLHIFIAHCTFSLHIVHFHCTYYPFPQEMISFWTLFTSHNSEKCEKVLGKKSNKVLRRNTCVCLFAGLHCALPPEARWPVSGCSQTVAVAWLNQIVINHYNWFCFNLFASSIMNFAADYGLKTRQIASWFWLRRGVLSNQNFIWWWWWRFCFNQATQLSERSRSRWREEEQTEGNPGSIAHAVFVTEEEEEEELGILVVRYSIPLIL